jgi:hypothetical protein
LQSSRERGRKAIVQKCLLTTRMPGLTYPDSMTNEDNVAQYMVEELTKAEVLHQSQVVYDIEERFGETFVELNARGGLVISPGVLREFEKLTKDSVVWSRRGRYWRKRRDDDPSSRMIDSY